MTAALALAALAALAGPTQESVQPAPLFVLEVDARVDLWFEVRAHALDRETSAPATYSAAVEALREVGRTVATPRFVSLLDGIALSAPADAPLADAFDAPLRLPPRAIAPGSSAAEVLAAARAAAEEIDALLPAFEESEWPARARALEGARTAIAEALPAELVPAVRDDIERTLGLAPSSEPVRMHGVTRMPPPGGVTLRTAGGEPRCVVRLTDRTPALATEVVLHELLHALVARQSKPRDLFRAVSAGLRAREIGDDRWRTNAVHTLYFLAAADLVRTHVDPEHVDYGESEGVYRRAGRLASTARPLWVELRAGEIDGAAFAAAVVEAWTPIAGSEDGD
ncbi:MAG: hypothetical protein AAF957_05315 [Planctomycetota bacterium]